MILLVIGVLATAAPLPTTAPAQAASPAAASAPLSAADLDDARGGASPGATVSTQTLVGVSGGNTINAGSVVGGGVSIGSGAFSGFNGLGNFVVNTGNNNVVQGALSVSISMPTTH